MDTIIELSSDDSDGGSSSGVSPPPVPPVHLPPALIPPLPCQSEIDGGGSGLHCTFACCLSESDGGGGNEEGVGSVSVSGGSREGGVQFNGAPSSPLLPPPVHSSPPSLLLPGCQSVKAEGSVKQLSPSSKASALDVLLDAASKVGKIPTLSGPQVECAGCDKIFREGEVVKLDARRAFCRRCYNKTLSNIWRSTKGAVGFIPCPLLSVCPVPQVSTSNEEKQEHPDAPLPDFPTHSKEGEHLGQEGTPTSNGVSTLHNQSPNEGGREDEERQEDMSTLHSQSAESSGNSGYEHDVSNLSDCSENLKSQNEDKNEEEHEVCILDDQACTDFERGYRELYDESMHKAQQSLNEGEEDLNHQDTSTPKRSLISRARFEEIYEECFAEVVYALFVFIYCYYCKF